MEALLVLIIGSFGIVATVIGAVNSTDNLWTTIGQIVLFITYLVGQWVSWKQAGRQRQWQIEDRDALAKTTKETAVNLAKSTGVALKQQTADVVGQVKEVVDQQTQTLTEAQRTRITDLSKAFDDILVNAKLNRRRDDRG